VTHVKAVDEAQTLDVYFSYGNYLAPGAAFLAPNSDSWPIPLKDLRSPSELKRPIICFCQSRLYENNFTHQSLLEGEAQMDGQFCKTR
jgi:hypothetical protein